MSHPYTNHLISETSPYLLQHAHNPVNWYPWGEAALQKAKSADKPILISIGYAACHWCHVMERESFEDIATAEMMNAYFINIKIDREERPDLDHIYMDAVQAITGSGGWPLNVFLTPDAKPFYGGTYFPPVRSYNRASWKEVLTGIHKSYLDTKETIFAQAENLTGHLQSANHFGIHPITPNPGFFSEDTLQTIASNLLITADTAWGGFGKAPKFPQTFSIQYLLRHYHFTNDATALQQALLSIEKMINGGIYDQLGGGFARYSTDNEWLAPHFEKMLYDNALLIGVLSEAYQITGKEKYLTTIQQTIHFIEREMMPSQGGFYSAIDADSEGVEGKFYTWSKQEIDQLLAEEEAELFTSFYSITEKGNWEHTNILFVKEELEDFAELFGISKRVLAQKLQASKQILMNYRSGRIRPQLDDKILLGWNALLLTAYAKAYAATGIATYKDMAIRLMDFLENTFVDPSKAWLHTYKNGQARITAFLDDYAYVIQAYIHLQEMTGNGAYLEKAKLLTEWVVKHFKEEETGFFFYTQAEQTDVIIRKKEVYDGAVPSGNAVMASNLHYLSIVFDLPLWAKQAKDMLLSLEKGIIQHPGSFGVWATALQAIIVGSLEIVVIGQRANDFLHPILQKYIPNKILQAQETKSGHFPLLAGKVEAERGETAFYLCKNNSCQPAFFTVEALLANV